MEDINDINDIVSQIAAKQACMGLKKATLKMFENKPYFSDEELIAYAVDVIKNGVHVDHSALITVWFKEWKASKEVK